MVALFTLESLTKKSEGSHSFLVSSSKTNNMRTKTFDYFLCCLISILKSFLDPVGSLVSTLLVVGWLWVGCHTFSKFVPFECCSVDGVLECMIRRV